MEQTEHGLTPVWDVGGTGCGLAYYTTCQPLKMLFVVQKAELQREVDLPSASSLSGWPPEAPSMFPKLMQGPRHLDHLLMLSQELYEGAGSETEQVVAKAIVPQ